MAWKSGISISLNKGPAVAFFVIRARAFFHGWGMSPARHSSGLQIADSEIDFDVANGDN